MITKATEKTLADYHEARMAMEAAEVKVEELAQEVLAALKKEGFDTISEDYGTFSVVHRVKWEYSDKYKNLEKHYKMMLDSAKSSEIEQGVAVKTESEGLSYRAK